MRDAIFPRLQRVTELPLQNPVEGLLYGWPTLDLQLLNELVALCTSKRCG